MYEGYDERMGGMGGMMSVAMFFYQIFQMANSQWGAVGVPISVSLQRKGGGRLAECYGSLAFPPEPPAISSNIFCSVILSHTPQKIPIR